MQGLGKANPSLSHWRTRQHGQRQTPDPDPRRLVLAGAASTGSSHAVMAAAVIIHPWVQPSPALRSPCWNSLPGEI